MGQRLKRHSDPAYLTALKLVVLDGKSPKEASESTGIKRSTFRSWKTRDGALIYELVKDKPAASALPAIPFPFSPEPDDDGSDYPPDTLSFEDQLADEKRDAMRRFLGTTITIKDVPAPEAARKARRMVIVTDHHGNPDPYLVAEVIRLKPDVIVFGGDVFDGAQVNHHEKRYVVRLMREEHASMRAVIELFLLEIPGVIILIERGNHDDWILKYFIKDRDPDMEIMRLYFRDPFELLIEGLPSGQVKLVNTVWDWIHPSGDREKFAETKYMLALDDVLISHANFSGKKAGAAVDKLFDWIKEWDQVLGLPHMRVLIQAHGHKLMFSEALGGHQIRIESGIAGKPSIMAYAVGYQSKWRPGSIGGVYLEQYEDNGVLRTDLSTVDLIRPRRSFLEKAG